MELLQLIAPVEARISRHSRWMPGGYAAPEEARLDTFGAAISVDADVWPTLRKWWLAHEDGANTPNWDIAVSCEIEGRAALILVEAKANVPELSLGGKPLSAAASAPSVENHRQIGAAIGEACAALRRINDAVFISRDSHYQLSNRLAFAWKLASLGVPTVLVYLGFVGDEGIADAGTPFRAEGHWEAVFWEYAHPIVPRELFGCRLECGAAPAWFLIRSRTVLSQSPPRAR